jgi:hypothetical protein
MTERRELHRSVPRGEAEIKYALRWAEAVLREWHMTHEEAALIVSEPRRSLDQNSKLWPMLGDIASQVVWHGQYLKDFEWKDVLTAALKRYRAVPGIDGGIVLLGMRTSRMTKSQLSELIELAYSFGSEHNVVWSEPAKKTIEEHRGKRNAA